MSNAAVATRLPLPSRATVLALEINELTRTGNLSDKDRQARGVPSWVALISYRTGGASSTMGAIALAMRARRCLSSSRRSCSGTGA